MNRRAFLSTLAAAVAGATLDPERLLWVPGQKRIFLPAVRPFAPVVDPTVGISMRWVKDYYIVGGSVERFDVLYGGGFLHDASLDLGKLVGQ